MDEALEYPGSPDKPDWDSLYLYRDDEVVEARPIFTGDVFFDVEVQGVGAIETKNVIVIQHPCALRTNGVTLNDSLMVAEVVPSKLYEHHEWQGNYRIMPLPELGEVSQPHHAGMFASLYLAIPHSLDLAKRVCCLSPVGVNLLLQRWIFHNSRVAIPTWKYNDVISSQYEEADLIEDWCDIRSRQVDHAAASREAAAWLEDDGGSGIKRRLMLGNPQWRPQIRRAMRKYARSLNSC